MNQLISHIEYLLHTHNCVIVPSLGGFVVNTAPTRRNGLSVFNPPECELVFNRELSHNDGLLVESYMRADGISFENATQKINDAVRQIKNLLRSENVADLGDLGSFRMVDDQRFVYQSKAFVRPEHFGLSSASLKPVIQLRPAAQLIEIPEGSKKSIVRKAGIGAAVAAVIAAVMLLFPTQDSTLRHQTAQFFSLGSVPSVTAEVSSGETPDLRGNIAITQPEEEAVLSPEGPRFYIVTGVYQVRKVADEMISLLHSEGFSTASMINRSNRIDVYASSFSTREEAEQNLKQLKKDFPNHRDAWVLKYKSRPAATSFLD